LKCLTPEEQLRSGDSVERRHRTCGETTQVPSGLVAPGREPGHEEKDLGEKVSVLLKTTVIPVVCFETASAVK